MSEITQIQPANNFNHKLETEANRVFFWLSNHWLAVANIFFLTYIGLPTLAPVLMAHGFTESANTIYWIYHLLCHQLPSRAYFIYGEQVAMCQRCLAMYGTLLVGGLIFQFSRSILKPLSFKWYVFFLVPIGLDGGMAFASELLQVVPMSILWIIGLILIGLVGAVLYSQNNLTWHSYLILSFGLLALIYLQFVGPHASNVYLRNITGIIFGIGTVWFAYPMLEESFADIRQELSLRFGK